MAEQRAVPTETPTRNWACLFHGHRYQYITGVDLGWTSIPVECFACVRCGRIA